MVRIRFIRRYSGITRSPNPSIQLLQHLSRIKVTWPITQIFLKAKDRIVRLFIFIFFSLSYLIPELFYYSNNKIQSCVHSYLSLYINVLQVLPSHFLPLPFILVYSSLSLREKNKIYSFIYTLKICYTFLLSLLK